MKKRLIILTLFIIMTMSACGTGTVSAVNENSDSVTEEGAETTAGSETSKSAAAEGTEASESAETSDNTEEPENEEASESAETSENIEASEKGNLSGNAKTTASAKNVKNKSIDNESETGNNEDAEEEEVKLPEYTVAAYEEPRTMYAVNPVNVRKGPTTDFDRVGGLNRGQEVSVTGQADTDWYEILYGEDKAYVSNHYLQNDKPADEPAPQPEPTADAQAGQPQQVQAVTEVKNVAGVIMVGDSRFVQMQANIGENGCTWVAESGKGYNWFNENAVARIDGCVGKGSKILINLGVNDPGNLKNYLTLVNAKAAEWVGKGASVYYASVNPVWENPHVTEEQVEYFNSQMRNGLSGDVHWIDSHSYLNSIGYKLVDGLHYNAETYQNLYAYFMSCL